MFRHDTHARARSLRHIPLEELGRYALDQRLIDGFDFFDDRVVITQGHHTFSLPRQQAVTFLVGMLQGRTWSSLESLAHPGPTLGFSPERPGAVPSGVALAGDLDARAIERLTPSALESTLQSLLTFTRNVGIIEGYDLDEAEGTVRIDISACSTRLPYADAVSYLFDCIQYEMRAIKQLRNTPGRSPSPLANEH